MGVPCTKIENQNQKIEIVKNKVESGSLKLSQDTSCKSQGSQILTKSILSSSLKKSNNFGQNKKSLQKIRFSQQVEVYREIYEEFLVGQVDRDSQDVKYNMGSSLNMEDKALFDFITYDSKTIFNQKIKQIQKKQEQNDVNKFKFKEEKSPFIKLKQTKYDLKNFIYDNQENQPYELNYKQKIINDFCLNMNLSNSKLVEFNITYETLNTIDQQEAWIQFQQLLNNLEYLEDVLKYNYFSIVCCEYVDSRQITYNFDTSINLNKIYKNFPTIIQQEYFLIPMQENRNIKIQLKMKKN